MADAPDRRLNLSKAEILLADAGPKGLDILAQILNGFGARNLHRASSAEAARRVLQESRLDLAFVDPLLPDEDGFELIKWLRRQPGADNRCIPIIVVSAHTQLTKVRAARDCGANFLLVKPLTPALLFERTLWAARDRRVFVESPVYVGPDRRSKVDEPPDGRRQRHDDPQTGPEPQLDAPPPSAPPPEAAVMAQGADR